jgi:hypothetical protein
MSFKEMNTEFQYEILSGRDRIRGYDKIVLKMDFKVTVCVKKTGKCCSCNRPWRPIEWLGVEVSRQSAHRWR